MDRYFHRRSHHHHHITPIMLLLILFWHCSNTISSQSVLSYARSFIPFDWNVYLIFMLNINSLFILCVVRQCFFPILHLGDRNRNCVCARFSYTESTKMYISFEIPKSTKCIALWGASKAKQ